MLFLLPREEIVNIEEIEKFKAKSKNENKPMFSITLDTKLNQTLSTNENIVKLVDWILNGNIQKLSIIGQRNTFNDICFSVTACFFFHTLFTKLRNIILPPKPSNSTICNVPDERARVSKGGSGKTSIKFIQFCLNSLENNYPYLEGSKKDDGSES